MSNISVIGGCGRVGLRFSLTAAIKGYKVTCIDIDLERIQELKGGSMPFVEAGAELYLDKALESKTLNLSTEYDAIAKSDIVVISIGTPVDSNLNPSLEPVAGTIFDIASYLKPNQLIIFRDVIAPGTLLRVKNLIEAKTNLKVGKDIYLTFCPEVTDENSTIYDLVSLPQPIGAYDEKSYKLAENFFQTITKGKITYLTPEEAMLAKLMKNAYTFVQNACANEFYLIAESHNADIHKILDSVNSNNNKIPNPSPSSTGPGTHKEGWFLANQIPYSDLITTSFKLNESMPAQIVKLLEGYKVKKIAILGMTNKANSDDTRSALGYKLRKLLYYKDYEVGCYDPYLPEYSDSSVLQNADALILMTRHKEFKDLEKIQKIVNNPDCVYVDISSFWRETRENGKNGLLHSQNANKKATK